MPPQLFQSLGSKWIGHLSHVQTAINSAHGASFEQSLFERTLGRIINLLPSVKVLPTADPSANSIASQIMKT